MESNFPPTDYKALNKAVFDWKRWQEQEIDKNPDRCKCDELMKILIPLLEGDDSGYFLNELRELLNDG